jgi:hypothetical protein
MQKITLVGMLQNPDMMLSKMSGVVPAVVAIRKLIEIVRQILFADVVIRLDDAML